jgi:hypothetical protein
MDEGIKSYYRFLALAEKFVFVILTDFFEKDLIAMR